MSTIGRRIPTDVRKIIGRQWTGDADRIVQDKLQELQNCTQGLGRLPITTKGDIPTFSSGYDRLPLGPDGYFLSADRSTATGLRWANVGASDQTILAAMIFGQ